jgi:hypothetical protein
VSVRFYRGPRYGDFTMVMGKAGKDASNPALSPDDILFCIDERQGKLAQSFKRGQTGEWQRVQQFSGGATYKATIVHNLGFVPVVHFTWIRELATAAALSDVHIVTTSVLEFTIGRADVGPTWTPSPPVIYEILRVPA